MERKSALIALQTSRKLKNLNNVFLAKEACITVLQDKWLTEQRKATPEIKAQIKKTADAKKKIVEKQDKAKAKNQTLEIKRLALSNKQAEAQLGSFKDILSDLVTGDKPFQPSHNQVLIEDL